VGRGPRIARVEHRRHRKSRHRAFSSSGSAAKGITTSPLDGGASTLSEGVRTDEGTGGGATASARFLVCDVGLLGLRRLAAGAREKEGEQPVPFRRRLSPPTPARATMGAAAASTTAACSVERERNEMKWIRVLGNLRQLAGFVPAQMKDSHPSR
jgi:hypothetical protein